MKTFKQMTAAAALLALVPMTSMAAEMTPITDIPAGVYEVDKTHASVSFKVSHLGLSNYTARFTDIDAHVTLDPKDVTKSTVTASVNPLSIKTDYPYPEKKDFDAKLSSDKAWLNGNEFPKLTFASTKIEKTGDNTAVMTGDLTMLGVTKPVSFDLTLNGAYAKKPFGDAAAFGVSASSVIKRSEWGFDTYVPAIGDEVTLVLEIEFEQAKAEEKK